ncbi:MAG: hypothetical protein IKA36_02215 [Clostridia bacterium]|nr:hypothetical protein [Clostridia bacterium]
MSTKVKTVKTRKVENLNSSLSALDMVDGIVINNAVPLEEENKSTKKRSKKVAPAPVEETSKPAEEPAAPTKEAGVQVQSFESYVNELNEREAAIAAAEKALADKDAKLNEKAANLTKAAEMLAAAQNNTNQQKGNKTMAEKKETTTADHNLGDLNMNEIIQQQQAEFGKLTVELKSEDYWTTAKKSFIGGASAAAGAGLVLVAATLIARCLGGGSSD